MKQDPAAFSPETTFADVRDNWGFDRDIPYLPETEPDAYRRERCVLDAFRPRDGRAGLPVLVHLHGGGLTGGAKGLNDVLQLLGCVQFTVEYRLSPRVECPAWIEDAAAAAAWVLRNAERYGGDPRRVFVYGESAGAYLASMLAADRRYLEAAGAAPEDFLGFASISGELMTHFLVRQANGVPNHIPVIDEFAPLHYIRADFPPFLMLTGGTGCEIDCRPAENKLMRDLLRFAGNRTSSYYELPSLTHGNVWYAVLPYLREFIKERLAARAVS